MNHPAQYAEQLLSKSAHYFIVSLLRIPIHFIRFQYCAQRNGVSHAPIQLIHGNFLDNLNVREAIASAGLVYINNPRFGPQLNMKILCTLVPSMQKGCKLICFDSCGLDQWDALQFVKMIHVPRGAIIDTLF